MNKFLRLIGLGSQEPENQLRAINQRRDQLTQLSDDQLDSQPPSPDLAESFARAATYAERTLGLRMFDVQLLGALALARGEIAEMQTGEGKTLAAVPAIVCFALEKRGVHVLTANDYLARRDAEWMRPIYQRFGLTVAHIEQNLTARERRAAYLCDVTYSTANEAGFDFLRDNLARTPDELVHRDLAFAVIDEADSILIDEARIPLVIAGGLPEDPALANRVDMVVRHLRRGQHYTVDENARNAALRDSGIHMVEIGLGSGNLFDEKNLRLNTAVQDSLHAHALLKRDVHYVIKNDAVELVDEFKGRIAANRRWPAGLQSAIEAKERVALKTQGRILGQITMQNFVRMYERICGMTGTAATQADEFWKIYQLPVTVIPTHRPVIRQDLPDIVYADKRARTQAVIGEIAKLHRIGRPVLVGTASVEESEKLSARLAEQDVPHNVLNARNDEAEAAIIAQAGALGAVTISTNMAGRGTDILLGGNPPISREKVVELGGLYVLGTTRHEARRIDNQLRGRAGRQGDPGTSRFFLSLEDDLLVKFGIGGNPDIDSVQRTAESQNLEIRETLWKYESAIELDRLKIYALRREILLSPQWSVADLIGDPELAATQYDEAAARRITLAILDDLWADYLANVAELRGGIHWVSWGGREPLYEFIHGVQAIYEDFEKYLKEEVAAAVANPIADDPRLERGATWTYLTTDQPFGTLGERITKGLQRKFAGRKR